jgi:hypothetical protein
MKAFRATNTGPEPAVRREQRVRRWQWGAAFAATAVLVTAVKAAEPDKEGWIPLFSGKDLSGWRLRHEGGRNGWSVQDGMLVNTPPSTDIVSEQKFRDFELQYEYMIPAGSNSGVYLRGRYEIQIDDAYGKDPGSHQNGAIYGVVTPRSNASKPAGEWQKVEAKIVGDRATVVLNGTKIIENAPIRVTGGALDDKVDEPGPIMVQGDHGKVTFRSIRIRPIKP